MKKILSVLIALFVSILCSAQNFTIPKAALSIGKGDLVPSLVSGQVIYATGDAKANTGSSMHIPAELANGVVIVRYRVDYVSYKKLTQPTKRELYISVVAGS